MTSNSDTELLRKNINEQLDRLLKQLAEVEEFKDELSPEDYEETKTDTKEQLEEFGRSLQRLTKGDMTLLDEMATMRIAIQAAISEAFKTPEIIALFAKKQPASIRFKLAELERDHKIGQLALADSQFVERKMEMLTALRKLDDPLTPAEVEFVERNCTQAMTSFEVASNQLKSKEQVIEAAKRTE